ncbi:MAG: DNA gyrase subunit A [Phycisphaeraceae bacterium]|nr:DNA gyrase subunit A [Phycisphaeraceae bacterium]
MAENLPPSPPSPPSPTPDSSGGAAPPAGDPPVAVQDLGPNPIGHTVDTAIDRELSDSYLTYAMSTIVDRALPDVRDGLKPSQRRILVAMHDLNLSPGRKHSKCAGIVGETMKKYHPHGDQAIYPTLVNMAQEWKTRCVLIDKQGNFGSIDPDPPAAMRYTEARLHHHAMEMLQDLELNTVNWQPNFDESVNEPVVLPAKFPNLLVNGSTGIAVGMASSMAPHNLKEICDAIIATIQKPDIELKELVQIVPGPDFPTGGLICGRAGIIEAYATGRGRLTLRAKIHHEQTATGRNLLIVTEIPYQVSKNDGIISKIVEARKADRLTDVADIVDESSGRSGMRVVIELKRGADPVAVENQLYQITPLQSTFSIINIALVKGQPRTLSLKELIQCFIDHRVEVVRRRTAHRLRNALQEAHRIEGLIYAVCDIEEVIKLIRNSRTREEAIGKLMARGFRIAPDHPHAPKIPQRMREQSADKDVTLSKVQAEAIGRLQLIQLVGLEIDRLVGEYAKLLEQIEEYEAILSSRQRVFDIIKEETADLKARYGDDRRTQFAGEVEEFDLGALTPVEQVVVTITHEGYIKRLPLDEYRTQGRAGRGVIGADVKEGDFTERVFAASTHDDLLCFTQTGRVFQMKVYEIPEAARTSRGRAIVNLLELREGERVCEFMPIEDFEKQELFLCFATAEGLIKRTALKDYRNVNRSGIIALGLREGDALIGVTWTNGNDHLLLGTKKGMAIRFHEDDARAMGRAASGVKGIELSEGDRVVGLVRVEAEDNHDLLTVTAQGFGKRTPLREYLVQSEDGTTRPQSRGGKGRKDIAVNERNGEVVGLRAVTADDDLVVITTGGKIMRIEAGEVRQTGRAAQGVRVINLQAGDALAGVVPVEGEEDDVTSVDQGNAAPPSEPSPPEADEK